MAQPYRASARRRDTPALRASQRGTGPLPYAQNARRQAMKRKRRRKGRPRYSSPMHRILRVRRQTASPRR